jgi:hypothetical protein
LHFRLTYAGELLGASRSSTRGEHKHNLRKHFHKQLCHFWENSEALSKKQDLDWEAAFSFDQTQKPSRPYIEMLKEKFSIGKYQFVPIVTSQLSLSCSLDILFLRAGPEGKLMQSGDIDNRLKTIFDSLRCPQSLDELGKAEPEASEMPFFCLLEDDRLITKVAVETDALLEPIIGCSSANGARIIINVNIQPSRTDIRNIDFIGN